MKEDLKRFEDFAIAELKEVIRTGKVDVTKPLKLELVIKFDGKKVQVKQGFSNK